MKPRIAYNKAGFWYVHRGWECPWRHDELYALYVFTTRLNVLNKRPHMGV